MTMNTVNEEERYVAPRVNVLEREDAVVVEAEVPGVAREDTELELRDGALHIRARVKPNGAEGAYRLRERAPAGYRRTFKLGDGIDTAHVEATLKDGVLKVTLQKSGGLKSRQISVN